MTLPAYGQKTIDITTPSPTPPPYGQSIRRSASGAGGGGAAAITDTWELIGDVTLVAPATQVDFTGLDGDTDEVYLLETIVEKVAIGASTHGIQFNADTAANYNEQRLEVNGVTASAARGTALVKMQVGLFSGIVDRRADSVIIFAKTGALRYISCHSAGQTGGGIAEQINSGEWTNTVANVTQISFLSSLASDFGTGSRFLLFKKVST